MQQCARLRELRCSRWLAACAVRCSEGRVYLGYPTSVYGIFTRHGVICQQAFTLSSVVCMLLYMLYILLLEDSGPFVLPASNHCNKAATRLFTDVSIISCSACCCMFVIYITCIYSSISMEQQQRRLFRRHVVCGWRGFFSKASL